MPIHSRHLQTYEKILEFILKEVYVSICIYTYTYIYIYIQCTYTHVPYTKPELVPRAHVFATLPFLFESSLTIVRNLISKF